MAQGGIQAAGEKRQPLHIPDPVPLPKAPSLGQYLPYMPPTLRAEIKAEASASSVCLHHVCLLWNVKCPTADDTPDAPSPSSPHLPSLADLRAQAGPQNSPKREK